MFALGHLIFEVFKIWILSSIYTVLVVTVYRLVLRWRSISTSNLIDFKSRPWKSKPVIFWIIYLGLFVFMFTYWGDHGLGDDVQIPIGSNRLVRQIDGMYAYIENDSGDQHNIRNFIVKNNTLFAEAEKSSSDTADYIVWNLKSDKVNLFNKFEYLLRTRQNGYPLPSTFANFDWLYWRYWNGWRFFLLP